MREFVVVIATAGRPLLLRRMLASLAGCARPPGYGGTIVVENGGQNGAEAIVTDFNASLQTRYHYVQEGNKSAALNHVLASLRDDTLIFFTDDDVTFAPGVVAAYAEAAEGTTSGKFYGGPTDADYEQAPPEWVRRHLPSSGRGWEPTVAEQKSPNLAFLGFNWAAFVRDLRAAGGFDPNRGPGAATGSTGQEGEMQARLRRAGVAPSYVPAARVSHYVPSARCTPEWVIDRAFRHGISYGLQCSSDGVRAAGCPSWLAVRLLKGALRLGIAAAIPNRSLRLTARVRQSYNRGLLHAYRLRAGGAAAAAAPPLKCGNPETATRQSCAVASNSSLAVPRNGSDATADILMITHSRPHYTSLSLRRLLDTCDERTRIWLWHNGTDEATLAVVRPLASHPRVHAFHHSEANVRLREPTNWLWQNATGDLLGKVDDDCLVPHGWIQTLRLAHADEQRFGIVACWHFDEGDFDPALSGRKIREFRGGHRLVMNVWLGGSGYLMKSACVKRLGLLKSQQSFTDYCGRVAASGWVNGWYYPLLYQEHMDDPRSPHSLLRSDEDLQRYLPLSALSNGVTTLAAWQAQLQRSALRVQKAEYDPILYSGWRKKLSAIGHRVRTLRGVKSQW